jgi:spermidine dehydrogenase
MMGRSMMVTRRGFLAGAAACLIPVPAALGRSRIYPSRIYPSRIYPPALTGLRGYHTGSFEAMRALHSGARFAAPARAHESTYDLVVIGAGLVGLAAAWYFRAAHHPDARVLILDNHDDIGGRSKQNLFNVDGETLVAGTQRSRWSGASPVAESLLTDLQFPIPGEADPARRGIVFSNKAVWDDALFGEAPLAQRISAIDAYPIETNLRVALRRLVSGDFALLPGSGLSRRREALLALSVDAMLRDLFGGGTEVLRLLRGAKVCDESSACAFLESGGLGAPGHALVLTGRGDGLKAWQAGQGPFAGQALLDEAALARRLAERLAGQSPLDYTQIDRADSAVRIRLNATAIAVTPGSSDALDVIHATPALRTARVSAKRVVLCDGAPAGGALCVVNVALRRAPVERQILHTPNAFFTLTENITQGKAATILQLQHSGDEDLRNLTLAQFERLVAAHLRNVWPGFDATKEIAAITVNRWPAPVQALAGQGAGDVVSARGARWSAEAAIEAAHAAVSRST